MDDWDKGKATDESGKKVSSNQHANLRGINPSTFCKRANPDRNNRQALLDHKMEPSLSSAQLSKSFLARSQFGATALMNPGVEKKQLTPWKICARISHESNLQPTGTTLHVREPRGRDV